MARAQKSNPRDLSDHPDAGPAPAESRRFKLHWTSACVLTVFLLAIAVLAVMSIVRGDAKATADLATGFACMFATVLGLSYGAFRVFGRSSLAGNLVLVCAIAVLMGGTAYTVLLSARAARENAVMTAAMEKAAELQSRGQVATSQGDTAEASRLSREIANILDRTSREVTGHRRTTVEVIRDYVRRLDDSRAAKDQLLEAWIAAGNISVTDEASMDSLTDRVELTRQLLDRTRALHEVSDFRLVVSELRRRRVPDRYIEPLSKGFSRTGEFDKVRASVALDAEFLGLSLEYLTILRDNRSMWTRTDTDEGFQFTDDASPETTARLDELADRINEIIQQLSDSEQ